MRRKVYAILMMLCILMGVFAACSKKNDNPTPTNVPTNSPTSAPTNAPTTAPTDVPKNVVDLKGMYTVKDPEGVEFDTRYELYMPYLKTAEEYAAGDRYTFSVIYGKDKKGQYMYAVDIFETEQQATAFQKKSGKGTVDGKAVVVISKADFFAKMEALIPTVDDWVNNMKQSGMMPIEE